MRHGDWLTPASAEARQGRRLEAIVVRLWLERRTNEKPMQD